MARMSDLELVAWMTNFINVASVDPAKYGVTMAIITEMTAFRDSLKSSIDKRDTSENVFRADVAGQQTSRNSADPMVSFVIAMVRKNPAVSDADKLALDVAPIKTPTSTPPVTPASITANGFESGINIIRWDRSGNKQTTQFVLEFREAGAAEFKYLVTVTDTVYAHVGMKPGVQCAYRVKAVRAGMESAYSNVAVVYMA